MKPGTFLRVKSSPKKVPEQSYINLLEDQPLVLVAVVASLCRDGAAAAQRQEQVKAYLDWIREKYQ